MEKHLQISNLSFCHNDFNSCLLQASKSVCIDDILCTLLFIDLFKIDCHTRLFPEMIPENAEKYDYRNENAPHIMVKLLRIIKIRKTD